MLFVRALLAALSLAILLVASPAIPDTRDDMQTVAATVGADVDVVAVDSFQLNAGFIRPGIYCSMFGCQVVERPTILFLGDWSSVPYDVWETVMLHELGHYRQWVEKRPMSEWDADLYAANTLCSRGRDGVHNVRQAAETFIRLGGSWGAGHGTSHGSWYERVENVRLKASACRREIAAP